MARARRTAPSLGVWVDLAIPRRTGLLITSLPASCSKHHAMASVWQDLNAFLRDGGPSGALILRAHRAASNEELCSWQAQDHIMGMGECGTMVQGPVLPKPSDRDGCLFVGVPNANVPRRFRIASAMPVLVVNMDDAHQCQRFAQLLDDARMEVVWRTLAVHCTSSMFRSCPCVPPNDFCMCAKFAPRRRGRSWLPPLVTYLRAATNSGMPASTVWVWCG